MSALRWDPPRMLGNREKLRLVCLTPKHLNYVFQELERAKEFSFDIETTHPTSNATDYHKQPTDAKILGISFSWAANRAAYIPVFRDDEGDPYFRDPVVHNALVARIRKILTKKGVRKIAQNGKFDCLYIARNLGVLVEDFEWDTMIAQWVIDENGEHENWAGVHMGTGYALDKQALLYLGDDACCGQEYDLLQQEVKSRDPRFQRYQCVPIDILGLYGASDALDTYKIYLKQKAILEQRGQTEFFLVHEMAKTRLLTRAEIDGLPIYTDRIQDVVAYLDEEMGKAKEKLLDLVGFDFDPAHAGNTAYVLFEHLKLPPLGGKGKSGEWSTKKIVLEKLAEKHDVPKVIIAYRNLSRTKTNYAEAMHRYIDYNKKIFHMGYKQHGTDTGRASAAIIQSMPSEKKGGKIVKGLFWAGKGNVFVFCDFSQIELRVMAELSRDPAMVDAFIRGEDIHTAAAKRILGVTDEWIGNPANKSEFAEIRRRAKTINFGILFGEGARKLSESLGITLEEAKALILSYFKAFPGVEAKINRTHRLAEETGQIRNIFGRIRHLEDIVDLASVQMPRYKDLLLTDDERSVYFGRAFGVGEAPACFRGRREAEENPFPPTISAHLKMDLQEIIARRKPPTQEVVRARLAASQHAHHFTECMRCPWLTSCSWEHEIGRRRMMLQRMRRQAFSSEIQGTAVDMNFYAMRKIRERIERERIPCHGTWDGLAVCSLQIHDEIGIRVAAEAQQDMVGIMKEEMERWPNEDFPDWVTPIVAEPAKPTECWADQAK